MVCKLQPHWLNADWLGFVKPAATVEYIYIYPQLKRIEDQSGYPPRNDTGPHGVQTSTPGTPLLTGVCEAAVSTKGGQEGSASPLRMI